MVAGDVVSGISVVSTTITFQPAATVSVCITNIGSYNGVLSFLTNGSLGGTVPSVMGMGIGGGSGVSTGFANIKLMIDNTNYFSCLTGGGQSSSFSGIQIK